MGSKRKWLFNCIFFMCIILLTVYSIFHNEDPSTLIHLLDSANGTYWLLAMVLVLTFICCESLILHLLFKDVNQTHKASHCLIYSFIGFFFSAITPAAGGGQPAQVYFMQKDGIDPGTSTPILVFVTICYKAVLVLSGIIMLIIKPVELFRSNDFAKWWCILGLIINALAVFLFMLLIINPVVIEKIAFSLVNILSRFLKSDKISSIKETLDNSFVKYRNVSKCIKANKALFILVLIISIFQRAILFSVTYLVLLSFGIKCSLLYTILMQSLVSLGTDLLPLPGGSGANEALFLLLFENICGNEMLLPVLIASRGLSYYGQLLICGIMFLIFGRKLIKKGNI